MKKPKPIWVVLNVFGQPMTSRMFLDEEYAWTQCSEGERAVKYVPAPTKRKRKVKRK